MINRTSLLLTTSLAAAFSLPLLGGCSKQAPKAVVPAHDEHDGHAADEHAAADHHDADHEEHGGKALTEESVPMPANFAAGVARLKELHQEINHLVESNKLDDVHHAAQEMGIVAKKMKTLASRDIPEAKRADAGRLCNDIAGYFSPIDEAADAGKKDETMKIHMQMADTIKKLDELTK